MNKIKAWVITISIHALLIALLLFVKYSLPANPLIVEDLLEVDLGTSDDGFGTDQPELMDGPAPQESSNGANNATATDGNTEPSGIEENNAPDAVSIRKPTTTIPNNKITNPKSSPKPKPNTNTTENKNNTTNNQNAPNNTSNNNRTARYTYQGGQGEGGNSASRNKPGGSQGDGSGSGDKGVPGGVVGGAYISAVPNLKGRSLRTRPDPKATFNEGGTVVVRVTVDKAGKIIRHSIVRASNATIQNLVIQKLKQVTFTESKDAPPEQSGTITFTFKTGKK